MIKKQRILIFFVFAMIANQTEAMQQFVDDNGIHGHVAMGHFEQVKNYLSDKENDVDAVAQDGNFEGKTLLYCAVANKKHKIIHLLFEHGARVEPFDELLSLALKCEDWGGARILIKKARDERIDIYEEAQKIDWTEIRLDQYYQGFRRIEINNRGRKVWDYEESRWWTYKKIEGFRGFKTCFNKQGEPYKINYKVCFFGRRQEFVFAWQGNLSKILRDTTTTYSFPSRFLSLFILLHELNLGYVQFLGFITNIQQRERYTPELRIRLSPTDSYFSLQEPTTPVKGERRSSPTSPFDIGLPGIDWTVVNGRRKN